MKRFYNWRKVLGILALVLLALRFLVDTQLSGWIADGMLRPWRKPMTDPTPAGAEVVKLAGDGVDLEGWRFPAKDPGPRRGTVIYLHGVADNRASGARGIAERFTPLGWEVLAYDNRAHGNSGGPACTYGYHEKKDLRRVIGTLPPGPVVLIGTSLGAAVALQTAAEEPRVSAVVAAEVFSDLRTVARDRTPAWVPDSRIAETLRIAEQRADFSVAEVSPVEAARKIRVPVLVIHGAADVDTRPEHSQRVFDALAGPKRLVLVPGAGHNHSLSKGETWEMVQAWVGEAVPGG
jgi:pimeloyl-ACP methyl ester carboxylesterase